MAGLQDYITSLLSPHPAAYTNNPMIGNSNPNLPSDRPGPRPPTPDVAVVQAPVGAGLPSLSAIMAPAQRGINASLAPPQQRTDNMFGMAPSAPMAPGGDVPPFALPNVPAPNIHMQTPDFSVLDPHLSAPNIHIDPHGVLRGIGTFLVREAGLPSGSPASAGFAGVAPVYTPPLPNTPPVGIDWGRIGKMAIGVDPNKPLSPWVNDALGIGRLPSPAHFAPASAGFAGVSPVTAVPAPASASAGRSLWQMMTGSGPSAPAPAPVAGAPGAAPVAGAPGAAPVAGAPGAAPVAEAPAALGEPNTLQEALARWQGGNPSLHATALLSQIYGHPAGPMDQALRSRLNYVHSYYGSQLLAAKKNLSGDDYIKMADQIRASQSVAEGAIMSSDLMKTMIGLNVASNMFGGGMPGIVPATDQAQ